MKRLILSVLTIAVAAGCTPRNTTEPAKQPIAPTTQAVEPTPVDLQAEWSRGVTKVHAHVVATTQPTTQRSGTAARPVAPSVTGAEIPTPVFTLDDLKRVDTSVSTAPLVRLLAMKLNGIPYQRFAGYGAIDFTPQLPEGVEPDKVTNEILAREPAGTKGAIQRLMKNEVDMVFLSRMPTDKELSEARKQDVRLRTDLIATEALVFTVNINNPAKSVTIENLQKLFAGEAKTWAQMQIAGFPLTHEIASKPVTIAYRAQGLGTEELMQQLLLDGKPLPEMPVSSALSSTKLVLDATSEDPQALGFSVFCYVSNMERDGKIKALAVNGVLPEPSRVASGEYPLTTPIYVVSRATLDPDSRLVLLRKWLLSMQGQKLLAEAGYMPIIAEAWTQQRLLEK